MAGFISSLLVAVMLGFLAGMGVGGGSLLLLWLTQIAGIAQEQARLINLLFYIPAAITATCFRTVRQQLLLKDAIPGIVTGCTAAIICSLLAQQTDTEFLKKLLGALLVLTGLRELFYRERNAR